VTAPFLVALLVAATPAGTGPSPGEVALGDEAYARFDNEAALGHYRRAVEADPSDDEAAWRLALAHADVGKALEAGDREEAEEHYRQGEKNARQAIAANPDSANAHFVLAVCLGRRALLEGGKTRIRLSKEVKEEAERAIELDPQHDGAYHVLGRWNAEIMRLSGMSRFFARQFLGAGIFSKASWDGAITNLERAVEIDPRRIVHRLDLARVYVDRKRYGDARRELETLDTLPIRDFNDPRYQAEGAALLRRIESKRDGK
jgi:tetratricopeptide (TPR) repeat protein